MSEDSKFACHLHLDQTKHHWGGRGCIVEVGVHWGGRGVHFIFNHVMVLLHSLISSTLYLTGYIYSTL